MQRSSVAYPIREMSVADHAEIMSLWKATPGLFIDEEDSYDKMVIFLRRNPGLNFVATVSGKIIATIKGAQDGRRGYISHMAVLPEYRALGIAKELIENVLIGLRQQGIGKCNLYVLDSNPDALGFWKHNGWQELSYNFRMLQRNLRT